MFRYLKGRTSYSNPATDDEDDDKEEEDIKSAALASNDDVEMPMDFFMA